MLKYHVFFIMYACAVCMCVIIAKLPVSSGKLCEVVTKKISYFFTTPHNLSELTAHFAIIIYNNGNEPLFHASYLCCGSFSLSLIIILKRFLLNYDLDPRLFTHI